MIFRRVNLTVATVGLALASWNLSYGQLDVELSVDVTLGSEGVYTYAYTLFNGDLSSQSINSILLSTGLNAPIVDISGPNENWFAAYAAEEDVFQAGFATGLSDDGECGATDAFDVFQGQTVTFSMTSPWAPEDQRYLIGRTGPGAACDFVGDFTTGMIASPSIEIAECDFDRDGVCGLFDIDELAAAISIGSGENKFDLSLDTAINLADLDLFLALTQRLNGDADFNGSVEFADFLVMSGNFAKNANWSQGDFDADGMVAFSDFLILSRNFGDSSLLMSAIAPEPSVSGALVLCVFFTAIPRRRNIQQHWN